MEATTKKAIMAHITSGAVSIVTEAGADIVEMNDNIFSSSVTPSHQQESCQIVRNPEPAVRETRRRPCAYRGMRFGA
jgi:hypothetical protein